MQTRVTFIYDYKNIDIPEPFLELRIPDVETIVNVQCEALAQKHSKIQLPEGQPHVLTDEMVKAEEIPGIETVEAYRDALSYELPITLVSEHAHMLLMNYLIPQLVQRSTFEINDEEATQAGKDYYAAFEDNAKQQGLSLQEAARMRFGSNLDEGAIRQHLFLLGRTNFMFRILAGEYLRRQGQTFDIASYSGYVKDMVKMSNATEEKVRELVPLNVYMDEVPALHMMDEMTAWLAPKIAIKTDEDNAEGADQTEE
ncbi:MAG: hypothetical protein GX924_06955 [Clostridiaceae bacterium]|nr:hypothetical protein [Clostridiaceae bacterium]